MLLNNQIQIHPLTKKRHGNRPTSHCSCTSPPRVDHPIHNNKTAALMSLHLITLRLNLCLLSFIISFFLYFLYTCTQRVDNSRACEGHASPNSSASCFPSLAIAEHEPHFFPFYKRSINYPTLFGKKQCERVALYYFTLSWYK